MPVDTLHEGYQDRVADWEMIRDALSGERAVKNGRTRYLPIPPGMRASSNELLASTGKRTAEAAYDFYISFAEFPEIVEPALTGFQGVVHSRTPRVQLPGKLEYLLDDSTPDGLDLMGLWQVVTREILAGGRIGLLADVSVDDLVRFVTYSADNVTNWLERPRRAGGGADFVVLRESMDAPPVEPTDDESDASRPDTFKVEKRNVWRELRLRGLSSGAPPVYQTRLWEKREGSDAEGARVGTTEDGSPQPILSLPNSDSEGWVVVQLFGNAFDTIPFLSINALDVGFDFSAIPMLPLTRRAYSVYRLTADYRRALYNKSDPQPYVAGIDKKNAPVRIGGDSVWTFPKSETKVGYLDIDGNGIPLMKGEIDSQLERFDQEGGRLLSTTHRPESGDALKHRLRAHQVTLRNVVISAANGLSLMLKVAARMLGADPDEVIFEPDLDFSEPAMSGTEARDWAQAKMQGFPISDETLHSLARRGGVTELSFEDEMEKINDQGSDLNRISLVRDDGKAEGTDGGRDPESEGVGNDDGTAGASA